MRPSLAVLPFVVATQVALIACEPVARGPMQSPDGEGYCCAPDYPTCECASLGGFVTDPSACGSMRWCDGAPADWILGTDAHGCMSYTVRIPTVCGCLCPRDLGVRDLGMVVADDASQDAASADAASTDAASDDDASWDDAAVADGG